MGKQDPTFERAIAGADSGFLIDCTRLLTNNSGSSKQLVDIWRGLLWPARDRSDRLDAEDSLEPLQKSQEGGAKGELLPLLGELDPHSRYL